MDHKGFETNSQQDKRAEGSAGTLSCRLLLLCHCNEIKKGHREKERDKSFLIMLCYPALLLSSRDTAGNAAGSDSQHCVSAAGVRTDTFDDCTTTFAIVVIRDLPCVENSLGSMVTSPASLRRYIQLSSDWLHVKRSVLTR